MAIQVGDVLGQKYRLDALIGRGGMGHVFAATDLTTTANVAVKVVSRLFFDDVLMARLHREAEAAAIIRSDYVPRVLEVSETGEKEVFLVMERLVGEPLSANLREKGTLPWKEVQQIGEDILRALIDAHTAGIVHRDLKPSNVFLALKQGRVRAMVLDFGVCKIDTVDKERLTATGESIGTVAYMAPEQIRGASKVDDRADLYAFGGLVFEMVCGRLPHEGPSQMAILASKLENDPARLKDFARVDVPAGLDALVAKTLERDPALRPSSAQELLRAWRGLSASALVVPTPGLPFATPHDEAPTEARALSEPGAKSSSPAKPSSAPIPFPQNDETHGTQTGFTTGVSSRRGSNGARIAIALAACGLVAGFASVAAFFARAPKHAASEVAPPVASETAVAPVVTTPPPPETAEPAETASAGVVELPTDPPADSVAAVTSPPAPATKRVRHPPPRTTPSAKPTNASHITEKPRF